MALLPGDSLDGRASSFKEKMSFSTVPGANLSESSHGPRKSHVTTAVLITGKLCFRDWEGQQRQT